MMTRTKMIPKELTRFLRRVQVQENGCWFWDGAKTYSGYGVVSFLGWQQQAHRVAYMHWVGQIPEGHEIHHRCGNRSCVNPDHLEPQIHHNHMRMHERKLKTECKRGHPFVEGSYRIQTNGGRLCLECQRIRSGAKWARKSGFCKNGHPLTEGNYYHTDHGKKKRCKICHLAYYSEWRKHHGKPIEDRDPRAVSRGRKGGLVRAQRLTPEERSAIGKIAAAKRYAAVAS